MTETDPVSRQANQPQTTWQGIALHHGTYQNIEVIAGTDAETPTEVGTRTVLILHDVCAAVVETAQTILDDAAQPSGIIFVLNGDLAARSLVDALEFAATTLRKQLDR
jgi:hypothetical protein